jgi:signal transduction histidine kinase
MVLGDADLLGAVIDNLIRNSIRFSPPEGRVEVAVAADRESVTIKVCDKGPGIAQQYLEKVFGRFFHLPGGDERIRGTGLGLAIARGMVELHRGTIHAASPSGGGCELVVQLPRHGSPTFNGE